MTGDIHWSVDSLVIRGNTLFGFGWIFHEKIEIVTLRLCLMSAKRSAVVCIPVQFGKSREDVACVFGDYPTARNSGYVVYGTFPKDPTWLDPVVLQFTLADGTVNELAIPRKSIIFFGNQHARGVARLRLNQFYIFFKRGLRLLRNRKFAFLSDKIRRYLRGRPKAVLREPSDLAHLLDTQEREDVCVIIDHDLGGGANHYRERLIKSLNQEGRTSLVLTYHVATLSHVLIVTNERISLRFAIPNESFLLRAVEHISVGEIIYNTGVSFVRPEKLPQLLLGIKAQTSARLRVLIHDFFMVCPSHFLLDQKGNFCRIPRMSRCATCLPMNPHGFTALFLEGDISRWRGVWGSLLASADEIVAFSNNSAQLLMRAYPELIGSRVAIEPHKAVHLAARHVKIRETGSLCIGIVGQIGYHKGAAFVRELAYEIKRREVKLKIVIIGSIEENCDPSIVQQTGPYKHEELPGLIEASGANVMLFPSICPETFSYVVQELIALQLPVASFALGAPAERLSTYAQGLVLSSMDPGRVLDELTLFHRRIYLACGGSSV